MLVKPSQAAAQHNSMQVIPKFLSMMLESGVQDDWGNPVNINASNYTCQLSVRPQAAVNTQLYTQCQPSGTSNSTFMARCVGCCSSSRSVACHAQRSSE